MLFVATWTDREIIMLSEVNQTKINNDISYMENLKKMVQMNLFTKQKYGHGDRKLRGKYGEG